MTARRQQQGAGEQHELRREARPAAEQADEARHFGEQRMAAFEHGLVNREVGDSEQEGDDDRHFRQCGEAFVDCQLPFVGRERRFVAERTAGRTAHRLRRARGPKNLLYR